MLEMTARELSGHLQKSAKPPIVLDVREPWEYRIVHLDNSINIPVSEVVSRMSELDAEREVVVVCHHGIRSRMVAGLLERNNFSPVINLRGGIDAWARELDPGMPTY